MATTLVCDTLLAAASAAAGLSAEKDTAWTLFGYDAARRNVGPAKTGITGTNVSKLVRSEVALRGTVDSSPLYGRAQTIAGGTHDVFFVQTTYGRAYAIDADTGAILWEFTPDDYDSFAGTYQITTASPALDLTRKFIYTASPDGLIHKLALATGAEVRADGWPARVTLDGTHEKLTSPLNLWGKQVIATTSSYGDVPPYQGHLVVVDRDTGRIVKVWNALCSNRHELMDPTTCRNVAGTEVISGASIWARAGAVRQPGTGNLIVTTANGVYDAHTRWSSSVVILSPNASRILKYWTPRDWEELSAQDEDLGSTAPALLTSNIALQGGKDGKLRLLDLRRFHAPPSAGKRPVVGGALQVMKAPGSAGVFTAPAVWTNKGVRWTFVATS